MKHKEIKILIHIVCYSVVCTVEGYSSKHMNQIDCENDPHAVCER